MKLNELFDTVERERKSNAWRQEAHSSKQRRKGKGEVHGTTPDPLDREGYYGFVASHRTDPHLVKKAGKEFAKEDAYFEYIKAIVRNKIAQHNPYAPRVYKMRRIVNDDGAENYIIDMEQLRRLDQCTSEQLRVIYQKLRGMEYDDDQFMPHDSDFPSEEHKENYRKSYLENNISSVVDDLSYRKGGRDEHLREIFAICQEINDRTKSSYDLHSGNMMVRLTPKGPQLVITDPIG